MVLFVRVHIGSGGLPACRHCGARPHEFASERRGGMRPATDVLAEVRSALAEPRERTGLGVWLAGAEAFAHPALPALISGAVEAGTSRVRITTGGDALAAGENAAGCLHTGVRHVEVVLLGGDASTHDALLDREGAFEAASEGVAALATASERAGITVSVTGRVPVCQHNIDHVPAAVATMARLGFDSVVIDVDDPESLRIPDGWVTAVADTGVVNGIWVSFEGIDPVRHGGSPMHAHAPWRVAAEESA